MAREVADIGNDKVVNAKLLDQDNQLQIQIAAGAKPKAVQKNHNLEKSLLRYLAKIYPKTTQLFLASREEKNETKKELLRAECYQAYSIETVALTGKMIKPATTTPEAKEVVAAANRFEKRQTDAIDLEVLCLVSNWQNLRELKPIDRINAVRKFLGHGEYTKTGGFYSDAATNDALRLEKTRLRLKLPSPRKRGHPVKSTKSK